MTSSMGVYRSKKDLIANTKNQLAESRMKYFKMAYAFIFNMSFDKQSKISDIDLKNQLKYIDDLKNKLNRYVVQSQHYIIEGQKDISTSTPLIIPEKGMNAKLKKDLIDRVKQCAMKSSKTNKNTITKVDLIKKINEKAKQRKLAIPKKINSMNKEELCKFLIYTLDT